MDAHDLFGLPLERFTTERAALAKELRGRGERDQAAKVAALRKPSVAAWAVNQLVRTQRRDVKQLFKAGDAAQRAQAELLAGRGAGPSLREALDRERDTVSRLVEAARGLLSSEGHELSPTMLERVADTLNAAALDEDARAEVESGCLQRELRHVGLGGTGLSAHAPTDAPKRRKTRARPKVDLRALTRAEAQTRREAERAAALKDEAVAKRGSAAEELRRAEKAVAEAERRARDARGAHRRAQRDLERARGT